jgi:hypothetical protein
MTTELINQFEGLANRLKANTDDVRIHKLADESLKHIGLARTLFSDGNHGGVTQALSEADHRLSNASKLLRGKMIVIRPGEDTPIEEIPHPDILQTADLGGLSKHHQDAVNQINEGLKNGR